MKNETRELIRQIYKEVDDENNDKSDMWVLQMTADTYNQSHGGNIEAYQVAVALVEDGS